MEKWIITVIFVCLFIAGILSLFASSEPDGLERVAEDHGFVEMGEGKEVFLSPMPDYLLQGVADENLAGSAAGIIGTLITLVSVTGVGFFLR